MYVVILGRVVIFYYKKFILRIQNKKLKSSQNLSRTLKKKIQAKLKNLDFERANSNIQLWKQE